MIHSRKDVEKKFQARAHWVKWSVVNAENEWHWYSLQTSSSSRSQSTYGWWSHCNDDVV